MTKHSCMYIVNCQKACKKCDDCRPCQRCIKYGVGETCVNSSRKERKRSGMRRGPYRGGFAVREVEDTDNSWTVDGERTVRKKKRVDYREQREEDYENDEEYVEYEEEEEGSDVNDGERDAHTKTNWSSPICSPANVHDEKEKHKPHQALFRLILSFSNGGLEVPIDQPKLTELAAVCAEVMEMDSKPVIHPTIMTMMTDRSACEGFDQRADHNRTPPELMRRDMFSPPATPLTLKTPQVHLHCSYRPPPPPAVVDRTMSPAPTSGKNTLAMFVPYPTYPPAF